MRAGCSHIQHAGCYKDWLQHSSICPLCKAPVKPLRKQKPKQ